MSGLTPKQQHCLNFIKAHCARQGSSPSYSEIAAGLGVKSRSRIGNLVDGLEARGAVRRIKGRYRSLEVIEPGQMRSVLLSREIHGLLEAYATGSRIGLDTAANELLRTALGAGQ